jgi:hypothetical protein
MMVTLLLYAYAIGIRQRATSGAARSRTSPVV